MGYFIAIVLTAIVTAGAAYYFKLKPLMDADFERDSLVADIRNEITSAHYAAFGPVGVRPEHQDEAFDILWRRVGKPERGMPR